MPPELADVRGFVENADVTNRAKARSLTVAARDKTKTAPASWRGEGESGAM